MSASGDDEGIARSAGRGEDDVIDETTAMWAAAVVAQRRRADPAAVRQLRSEVVSDLSRIDAAARRWTRLGHDLPDVEARVVGRSAWIRANLAALRGAFEPMRARLQHRHALASRILGAQVGALFGLLSSKVLGQYVLPFGGPGGGQLLVVGPNVLDLADEHGHLAQDIRRAVVLHEVTHRLQFDAHPWLGDHLRGLIDRYMAGVRIDGSALLEAAPRIPEAIAAARETGDVQPLLQTVLTEDQLEVVDEAQGMMSLLEGHGNTAMYDAAGRDLIGEPEAVREALASRRQDVTSKVLTAVAGMEMKRRQYREGEAFVRDVIDRAGMEALNRAFDGPQQLPALDEISTPELWLARTRAV